ncbi:MAG TPA: hypothetical protein VMW28_04845 [Pelolinea sp.]|nr:hypothetical protein [Pelolinea sp.]
MENKEKNLQLEKWFYPSIYVLFTFISFFPSHHRKKFFARKHTGCDHQFTKKRNCAIQKLGDSFSYFDDCAYHSIGFQLYKSWLDIFGVHQLGIYNHRVSPVHWRN